MPPKAVPVNNVQQKGISKTFLFQVESKDLVTIPLATFITASNVSTTGKGKVQNSVQNEDVLQDLYLYMLFDFQPLDGESTPLYPIPIKCFEDINLAHYKTLPEEEQILNINGYSTDDKSLALWHSCNASEGNTSESTTKSNQIKLNMDSEETFLELIQSSVVGYLVACRKLPPLANTQSEKKKHTSSKGKLEPDVLSRQRVEAFLTEYKGVYLQEFHLGKCFLKRFAFDIRIQVVLEGVYSPITVGKKNDQKKNLAVTHESPSGQSLSTNFTISLLYSPLGLLADVDSSPHFLRIRLEKLGDMPSNEYAEFSKQIKPVSIDFNINGEKFITPPEPQAKTLKLKFDTIIQIHKEKIEDWRNYIETERIRFNVRDRNLKALPLPNMQIQTENSNEGNEDSITTYYPSSVTQYYAIGEFSLESLARGQSLRIYDDIPLQRASENIAIPIPTPSEPEFPVNDASKSGKTAVKGKSKNDVPIEEQKPTVEYTVEPIIVKSGQYVESGSFLRVIAQLSKKLPPPDPETRIGRIVVYGQPEQRPAFEEICNFIDSYTAETVEKSISPQGNGKVQEASPSNEQVMIPNDFLNSIMISSPEEVTLVVEGLNMKGIRSFASFVHQLKKEYGGLKIIANPNFSYTQRLYIQLADKSENNQDSHDGIALDSARSSRIWNFRIRHSLENVLKSSEVKSNRPLLNILTKLIDFMKASTLSQIHNSVLWPTFEDLEIVHNLFGISSDEEWEALINACKTLEEDSSVVEQPQDKSNVFDLNALLGQSIEVEGIPILFPPSNMPDARKVFVNGEQERWEERKQQSNVQSDDDENIIEDKLWIYVPSLNRHLLIALLPKQMVVPRLDIGDEVIMYKEADLPGYNIMSSFHGVLENTNLDDVHCIIVDTWSQRAGTKIDNMLAKEYIPTSKKYSKNHFVNQNKSELHKKSELIRKKRKIEERIENNKLHPLVREARRKVIEAGNSNPVFLYSGQKNRWSELQQEAMREAMKNAKRKQNYTFCSSGDYLSLSFSAISSKEEEKAKQFRDTDLDKDKPQFQYPAPRPPGTWTKPDKALHPSTIIELQTTSYTSPNPIQYTRNEHIPGKPSFQVAIASGKAFSNISSLDSGDTQVGLQKAQELQQEKEKQQWRRKVVVDDLTFHVSSKSNMHPLEKKNTMLQDKPRKKYLQKKPLIPESQSIHSAEKFEDVAKRPFQQVFSVVPTRTQLPITLGKRENIASFYISRKSDAPLSMQSQYKRSIKPLVNQEKRGSVWGKS